MFHSPLQHPDDQSHSFSRGVHRYAMLVITAIPNFICILHVAGLRSKSLSPVPESLMQISIPSQSDKENLPTHL